jgi:uncharacterized membrane protein
MVFARIARNKFFLAAFLIVAAICFVAPRAEAQTSTTIRGKVVNVISTGEATIPGTQVIVKTQKIEVSYPEPDGSTGTTVIENDYYNLNKGAKVWIHRNVSEDGQVTFAVFEPDRTNVIIIFGILFLVVLFAFGGKSGLRGLLSLIGSLLLISFVLIPGILKGYSPVLISIAVASLISIVGSYVTHGFNRMTTATIFGMITTVVITGILSAISVSVAHLTGVTSDESVYLNLNTSGALNMSGILLGGILIGLLGVLYDAAIAQSVAIEELCRANPNMDKKELFARGMRIGREHIGALVDTLAIAYVGVSLPLLLLFASGSWESPLVTINREHFTTEILRTFVGSIGLILAVPITTWIAVKMLHGRKFTGESHGHSHGPKLD